MTYGHEAVHPDSKDNPQFNYHQYGLTKREYFAAMAMQGIIAAHNIYETGIDNEVNARTAINAADALIEALNKTHNHESI